METRPAIKDVSGKRMRAHQEQQDETSTEPRHTLRKMTHWETVGFAFFMRSCWSRLLDKTLSEVKVDYQVMAALS